MAKHSIAKKLAIKALDAAKAAIEIYNKPQFQYKNESFVVLMVNSWELLLKAKLLKDNPKNQNIIHIQSKQQTKTGGKPKRFYPVKNRAGNPKTIEIFEALRKAGIEDSNLIDQIELIVELRDNAIHFLNDDSALEAKLFQIATATTRSFILILRKWFAEISEENSILPISFSTIEDIQILPSENQGSIKNLVEYIEKIEKRKRPITEHAVSFHMDIQLKRSFGAGTAVKIDKTNPDAIPIKITDSDLIESKYKYDFEQLRKKCKERKPSVKFDKKFMSVYKQAKANTDICMIRQLDPRKPNSAKKIFFSEQALDFILARI